MKHKWSWNHYDHSSLKQPSPFIRPPVGNHQLASGFRFALVVAGAVLDIQPLHPEAVKGGADVGVVVDAHYHPALGAAHGAGQLSVLIDVKENAEELTLTSTAGCNLGNIINSI